MKEQKTIVEKLLDRYTIKVRMPILNRMKQNSNSILSDDLNEAVVSVPPNFDPNINVGDVVFVGFEDNDVSYPVVLGYMMTTKESRVNKDLNVTLTATSLKVKDSAELPSNLTFVSPNQERKILSFENIWNKVEDKQ